LTVLLHLLLFLLLGLSEAVKFISLLSLTPSSAAVYKLAFLHKIGEANAKKAIYKLSSAAKRNDAETPCYVLFFLL
jgi:hypothetical protein